MTNDLAHYQHFHTGSVVIVSASHDLREADEAYRGCKGTAPSDRVAQIEAVGGATTFASPVIPWSLRCVGPGPRMPYIYDTILVRHRSQGADAI